MKHIISLLLENESGALSRVAGLDGVIVGRAIYEGRIDVARAIEVLS